MSGLVLAEKGCAVPAARHDGSAAVYGERRVILLPAFRIGALRASGAGRLARRRAPEQRRRFTFRIDPARDAALIRAAGAQGTSRQRFLTEALDRHLARADVDVPREQRS